MTEIEKVKQEIQMLQSKLSFLEEIEKHNAKTKMTEDQHLECEIEELRLDIKENAERIDNLCNLIKKNNEKLRIIKMNTNEAVENKLQSKNWKVEVMNANYPMLEVIDENTVKIDGVEYNKVEKQKPQTLFQHLNSFDMVCPEFVCNIVRGWLIDHTIIETEDAEKVTFTILKEQLQTPK